LTPKEYKSRFVSSRKAAEETNSTFIAIGRRTYVRSQMRTRISEVIWFVCCV